MWALRLVDDVLVSGSDDSALRVWNTHTWECDGVLEHTNWVRCLAEFKGMVVSGSDDKTIKLWDPRTGQCERSL